MPRPWTAGHRLIRCLNGYSALLPPLLDGHRSGHFFDGLHLGLGSHRRRGAIIELVRLGQPCVTTGQIVVRYHQGSPFRSRFRWITALTVSYGRAACHYARERVPTRRRPAGLRTRRAPPPCAVLQLMIDAAAACELDRPVPAAAVGVVLVRVQFVAPVVVAVRPGAARQVEPNSAALWPR